MMALSAVTTYSLARRMAEASLILTEQFRKLLLPIASELHASDDRQRLRFLYTVGTRMTLAIYVPLSGYLRPSERVMISKHWFVMLSTDNLPLCSTSATH